MQNYSIVKDEGKLKQFIDWLPSLEEDEKYFVSLFSRKKYDTTGKLKSDKGQLKRFTSTKELLFDKIKQLEIPLGFYKHKDVEVPQETLALYIGLNPRSLTLATKKLLVKLIDLYTNPYNGHNPHSESLTAIQTSVRRKIYFDFDFDIYYSEIKDEIINILNEDAMTILHTAGGFHLLVELSKIQPQLKNIWYNNITKLQPDVTGTDTLIPVPGCVQGQFIPILDKCK